MATVKIETEMNTDSARALFAWGLAVADLIVESPGGHKLRLGDVLPRAVAYMAHRGAGETMTNTVAGLAKKVEDAAALATATEKPDSKPWDAFAKEAGDPTMAPTEANVKLAIESITAKRFAEKHAEIIAGSIAIRPYGEGGKRSAKEVWIDTMALGEIKVKHDKAGKEMPKGKDLKALVAKYADAKAAYFEKLWAEHSARLAGVAETADEILGF